MPPLPSANKILKVRFIGNNQTYPWNCIVHTQYTSASPTESDLTTYATAMATNWNTNIAPICGTQVELTTVDVVDLSSPTSPSSKADTSHFGTRAGSPLPANIAVTASWHINLRYRGGHPRTYWPGGVQTDMGNVATWLDASRIAFTSAFAAFRTSINGTPLAGGSTQLVMLSYFTNKALRPTPLPVTINSVTVDPRIDSQRRRLGKDL